MSRKKSNKKIEMKRDPDKSYVYVSDGKKNIGILMWHYQKRKWVFQDNQGK